MGQDFVLSQGSKKLANTHGSSLFDSADRRQFRQPLLDFNAQSGKSQIRVPLCYRRKWERLLCLRWFRGQQAGCIGAGCSLLQFLELDLSTTR